MLARANDLRDRANNECNERRRLGRIDLEEGIDTIGEYKRDH
jgi:hypothetical protein